MCKFFTLFTHVLKHFPLFSTEQKKKKENCCHRPIFVPFVSIFQLFLAIPNCAHWRIPQQPTTGPRSSSARCVRYFFNTLFSSTRCWRSSFHFLISVEPTEPHSLHKWMNEWMSEWRIAEWGAKCSSTNKHCSAVFSPRHPLQLEKKKVERIHGSAKMSRGWKNAFPVPGVALRFPTTTATAFVECGPFFSLLFFPATSSSRG